MAQEDTTNIPMTIEQVSVLASAYPDPDEWLNRMIYDNGFLVVPNSLVGKVAAVNVGQETKDQLLVYSEASRFQKQCAGVLVGGYVFDTTPEGHSAITSAAVTATADSTQTFHWKLPNGEFVDLSAAEVINAANEVTVYINSCFVLELSLEPEILNGSITTRAQLDAAYGVTRTYQRAVLANYRLRRRH